MGMFDNLVSFIRGRTPYRSNGWQSINHQTFSWFGRPSEYDFKPILDRGLWTNSTVACGIDWLSRNWNIPQLQIVTVDEEGIETPIHRHPALSLISRPQKYIGGEAFSGTYIRDMCCTGNSWIEKVYNRLGDVVELKPWNPMAVTAVFPPDGSEYLSAWKVAINGVNLDVPPDRVIYSRKYIDPIQDRLGWSPLRSAIREISTLDEASTYTCSLLANFCVPGMIASPKGDYTISTEDALRVKEVLKDSSTGPKRGDPIVLSGSYDLVKAGFTPEEVALSTIARPAQAVVLAAMGLNADVLGISVDKGSYGTYGEAIRAAYVHGLIPLQKLFAEEMTQQLLIDFEDPEEVRAGKIKFSWDYSPVEELDDREQVAANRAIRLFQAGVSTLNESRDIVGYGPNGSPDANLLGIEKDKARMAAGLDQPAGGKVSEGDKLGGVKIPANSSERSKLEGERNSDALSPSRSGINKNSELAHPTGARTRPIFGLEQYHEGDDDDDLYDDVFKNSISEHESVLAELEALEFVLSQQQSNEVEVE